MMTRWGGDERTEAQARAYEAALQILQPHFAGESLKIYVPKLLRADRKRRNREILEALAAGSPPAEVARAFGLTPQGVRRIERKEGGDARPARGAA